MKLNNYYIFNTKTEIVSTILCCTLKNTYHYSFSFQMWNYKHLIRIFLFPTLFSKISPSFNYDSRSSHSYFSPPFLKYLPFFTGIDKYLKITRLIDEAITKDIDSFTQNAFPIPLIIRYFTYLRSRSSWNRSCIYRAHPLWDELSL